MGSKLYRSAPEHVRPVTAFEAKGIQIQKDTTPISIIAQQLRDIQNQGINQALPDGMNQAPPQVLGTPEKIALLLGKTYQKNLIKGVNQMENLRFPPVIRTPPR